MARSRTQYRAWTAVFWTLWCGWIAVIVWTYLLQKDRAQVPVHVGPTGRVDTWGSPLGMFVGMLVMAAFMVVCGPVLCHVMPRFGMKGSSMRFEAYWNTPERRPVAVQYTQTFAMTLMSAVLLMGLASEWDFLRMAQGRPMLRWPFGVGVGLLVVQLVAGTVMLMRALRPPQWWFDCRRAHGHRFD